MFELSKLVRKNILNLKPYSSARHDFKGEAQVYLDANENPFGEYNRYPDPFQSRLKTRLSELKGADEDQIFLGNGSDEVIDLAYRIFCEPGTDKAMIFSPGYGMYEVSAAVNNVEIQRVNLNKDFQIPLSEIIEQISDPNLKLIFVCSPNNPSGNVIQKESITELASRFQGLVIVDEAYIDFAPEASVLNLINQFPNLLVMQTLSKAWGLAAIRIGIGFGSPQLIQLFNKVKPPYNISKANEELALQFLSNTGNYEEKIDLILIERQRVVVELNKLDFVRRIYPSEANFILVEVDDANKRYNQLLEKGVVVRNRNAVVRNCLRITIGKQDENDKLIKALSK